MNNNCVLEKLRRISAETDKFIANKIKECNFPILKNHIPLFYILPEDGESMLFYELAQRWKISKSSLSDIVSKYDQLGFLDKCECSEDKRAVYIRLTAEGVVIRNKLVEVEEQLENLVYDEISPESQSEFELVLDKILNNTTK